MMMNPTTTAALREADSVKPFPSRSVNTQPLSHKRVT